MKKMYLILFPLLFLNFSLLAQASLRLLTTISGENDGDHFSQVCPLGDVNGDGYYDFVVGSNEGKYVKLYFGGSPFDTLNYIRFFSNEPYTSLGTSYVGEGDLNGDGYKDFVLGTNYGPEFSGKIFIYFGKPNISTIPDLTISSNQPYDFFSPKSISGDLNGDGYDDLVAVSGVLLLGKVHIYLGGVDMNTESDITLVGKGTEDYFGWDASIVGDVNKDGYDDLLVGAPEMFNQSKHGKAYLFFGGKEMGWNNSVEIKADSTAYEYGIEVSRLGDVDGDGHPDFAIRSWYVDIISGKTLKPIKKMIPNYNWGIFQSISNGFDLNGDGCNDFILGIQNKSNQYSGGAIVYMGGKEIDTINVLIINGNFPNCGYANRIRFCGDINGDRKEEIFVGENGSVTYDGENEGKGKVYIYNWDSSMSISDEGNQLPNNFTLYQNYPNPFNPSTTISYSLAKESDVLLEIYNTIGKKVNTLFQGTQAPGNYSLKWNGVDDNNNNLSSSVYFLRIIVKPYSTSYVKQQSMIKMMLVK